MDYKLYKELKNSLNTHSGIVQQIDRSDQDTCMFHFKAIWENGIAFTVVGQYQNKWFYVEKENHQISATFHFRDINSKNIRIMQNMIDEIESGKYRNKMSLNEKVNDIICKRQLTSYMNNTKWCELINDISEIKDLPISYKTLLDESDEDLEGYWTIDDDEYFYRLELNTIEWFKIADSITKSKYIGRLVEPIVEQTSVKDLIDSILKKHSINYVYDDEQHEFIVYGYK